MTGFNNNFESDAAPVQESHFKAATAARLADFEDFGPKTRLVQTHAQLFTGETITVPTYVNEFWTSKQRAASSLHEISYRACFKPQLPRFFIQRFTEPGDVVYDPFMGRGTTLIEAALLNRSPRGCDINPLSVFLTQPRLEPPSLPQVQERLYSVDWSDHDDFPEELLVFYHQETLRDICALKKYLLCKQTQKNLDSVDRWIWMVALNRLTGHSPGFFSVYTLPPNQAVSVHAQRKINARLNQIPPRRKVTDCIVKKTRQLLADCDDRLRNHLKQIAKNALLLTASSNTTPQFRNDSVSLVVTSPPFLDIVNYATDNWLRCWFIGIDAASVALTVSKKVGDWQQIMTSVFHEMFRILQPNGHVAFEVGEVRGGTIKLEEAVLPCGALAGFEPVLVLINDQKFTKTANCWGVDNNFKGTNTNRVVVFRKPKRQVRQARSRGH
jgi:hypothetical protein